MTFTPALFPDTDAVIRVPGAGLAFVDGSWIFRFRREVRSLNRTMWSHWRNAQREREAWELEFAGAIAAFICVRTTEGWREDEVRAIRALKHQRERRRVRVTRLVPHRGHFLDPGNLRACDKHLVDAMTHVGLIHNDNRTWLEHLEPLEAIGPRGQCWTVVQLDRPDVRGSWRS